jgi:hypothetical protein
LQLEKPRLTFVSRKWLDLRSSLKLYKFFIFLVKNISTPRPAALDQRVEKRESTFVCTCILIWICEYIRRCVQTHIHQLVHYDVLLFKTFDLEDTS